MHFSFLPFSLFFAIFQVLQCVCLIFHVFQFSHHTAGPTLGISHFPGFLVVLAIFQVKQCLCTIFDLFQFSRHFPGLNESTWVDSVSLKEPSPDMAVSFSTFLCFIAILQVLQCVFLIFHVFHCFSPYSRSYNVCISFSTIFSVSRHIQGLTR